MPGAGLSASHRCHRRTRGRTALVSAPGNLRGGLEMLMGGTSPQGLGVEPESQQSHESWVGGWGGQGGQTGVRRRDRRSPKQVARAWAHGLLGS